MHFDPTVNLGNIITGVTCLILALLAWRDLTWRIRNLEIWRKEHMIDADSRDAIIKRMDSLLGRIDALMEGRTGGRRVFIRDGGEPYQGPERRHK